MTGDAARTGRSPIQATTLNRTAVRGHSIPTRKRVDIPDRSDLEALRQYLNAPRPLSNGRLKWSCLRVLVLLGASCGMRAGEVAGLRWDSIDPATGEIDIREAIAAKAGRKGPKTEAGYRKVPTTLRARDIINEHAEIYKQFEGKCVGSVLKSRDMDFLRPGMVSGWFREVMQECGLVKPGTKKPKFSFHALRHWCASHWMKATGGDVHQVAKWMTQADGSPFDPSLSAQIKWRVSRTRYFPWTKLWCAKSWALASSWQRAVSALHWSPRIPCAITTKFDH